MRPEHVTVTDPAARLLVTVKTILSFPKVDVDAAAGEDTPH